MVKARSRRSLRLAREKLIVALAPFALGGCAWLDLTIGALRYPTTQGGEVANVVVAGDYAYATRGTRGIEVIQLTPTVEHRAIGLDPRVESADDLAIADGLLFVLDARPAGHLAVYSLADPEIPRLVAEPLPVDVGPFSGVAAAAGRVLVSGGTSQLTLRGYDTNGHLGEAVLHADLGRGQPDVAVSRSGGWAFVSTHDFGPFFQLTALELAAEALIARGTLPLDTYGFTPGGAKPANFPLEVAPLAMTLYVAHAAGLAVVDITDPAAPTLRRVFEIGVEPVSVDAADGLIAAVGSHPTPTLVLLDPHDEEQPRIRATLPLPAGSRPSGVAIAATHVVVAAHGAQALVYERHTQKWVDR